MAYILIADDEESIIELIELYLEGEDKTIFRASNGKEALEIVGKHEIDLGIIDIMMPLMNGFQVIRQIRETHAMPLIVLSAREDFSDKIHGLDIGADDYITKPGRVFTKQQIYESVWEETYYGDENTIRIHMSHLREKLNDETGELLLTVRGLGYKIEAAKVVRL